MTSLAPLMTSARTGEAERDFWRTPSWLIERIRAALGPIGLDPCAADPSVLPIDGSISTVRAAVEWHEGGLSRRWGGHGLVFVNYSYSQSKVWASVCAFEAAMGTELVVLPAARVETAAWSHLWRAQRVIFLNKMPCGSRVHFVRPNGTIGKQPTFPSALVYFGKRIDEFSTLRDLGTLVQVVR